MSNMMECWNCGNKTFIIILTREKEPLINKDEFFCTECGQESQLPEYQQRA